MKNEVFERDYAEEFRERQENRLGRDFLDALQTCGFFEQYKKEIDKIPKRIVPKRKEDYEYLLGECDALCATVWREDTGCGGLSEVAVYYRPLSAPF